MATIQQKAGEEADRMIAELNQRRIAAEAVIAPGQQVEDQSAGTEVITENVPDEAGNQTDVGVQATSPTQVDSSALASLQKEVETANQRWNVLQGMINKKDSEIENMRALLAQVSQKAETSKAESRSELFTEEDETTLGPDYTAAIQRLAADVFDAKIQSVVSMISELKKSISGVEGMTVRTSSEMFSDALGRQVPDWESINVDPAFLAWLNTEEGLSGSTRLSLLTAAYSNMDLPRTVKFFKAFKDSVAPAAAPQDPKKDNVTKLISPGKSKASSTPAAPSDTKQIWSKEDISRLYDDRRNNRITQEEFDKYERDLFKAQAEGRLAA